MIDKKKKSKFFERMIKEYGKTFLETVNSEILKRNSGMLFRDIVHSSIDKTAYSQYFSDNRFMDVIINEANRLAYENNMHHQALRSLVVQQPELANDQRFILLMKADQNKSIVYNEIFLGLQALRVTGNMSILDMISAKTRYVRYAI